MITSLVLWVIGEDVFGIGRNVISPWIQPVGIAVICLIGIGLIVCPKITKSVPKKVGRKITKTSGNFVKKLVKSLPAKIKSLVQKLFHWIDAKVGIHFTGTKKTLISSLLTAIIIVGLFFPFYPLFW